MKGTLGLVLALLGTLTLGFEIQGAACCAGGGPRSFIALQEMQEYEIGFSTSYREVYGLFDVDGSLIDAETNQTMSLSFGAAARVMDDLEAFAILPLVNKLQGVGGQTFSAGNIGDILLGGRYTLYRPLLLSEWYPTVVLLGGIKLPTGQTEPVLVGNGAWEPAIGLEFNKALGKRQMKALHISHERN